MRTFTPFTILILCASITKASDFGNLGLPRIVDQSVSITDLGVQPGKEIASQQELLRVAMVKALAEMKIPKIAIDLVFHDEKAPDEDRHLVARILKMPGLGGPVQLFMVRVSRAAVAKKESLFLEYVALHELAHVKNGDLGSAFPLDEELTEDERERRVDYTVFKTVGWDRFSEMQLCLYFACHKDEALVPAGYLDQIQKWLGIYPQPKKQFKPTQ